MKIPISHLQDGHHSIELSAEPVDFGLDEFEPYTHSIALRIELERRGGTFYLHYFVSTAGTFTCDRCLEPFVLELKADFQTVYYSSDSQGVDLDEETHLLAQDAIDIDITEDIRETVLLAVPLKLLCRPDCKGLCPQCGANLNYETCSCSTEVIDPRWAKLKQLKL
jgi:uncharacterized protein